MVFEINTLKGNVLKNQYHQFIVTKLHLTAQQTFSSIGR